MHIEQKLLNEYENNPELIGGAFATLLPLGFTKSDLGKGGTLPKKLVRTWLLSHDRRFATHRNFNHFIFNQNIRHETNLKVSMRVKGNDERTRKLTKIVNEHDFEERLRIAVDNPTGEEARRISKSVLPFLKIVGSKVKWSSMERSNTLTHLYAMNQFFGLSFLFVTLSPSMRNSPLALRLCYCSEDKEFVLPDLVTRTKLIANDPVVAARIFHRVVYGFFEIICGMPLCHFTGRKTNIDRLLSNSQDGYIGVFGKLKAVYAVTEDQTGGSLHMHGQLFGMLDQRVLTRWIHDKGFRNDVCNFIDAIVTTEIPDAILQESQHSDRTTPVASQPYPTVEELSLDSAFCRLRLNSHRHSFTCWKGECVTCRMAYPRQLAQRTYVTEVIPDTNITNDLVPVRRYPTDSNGDEKISDPPSPTRTSPVDTPDERILVSGLRRTSKVEQNQSESNPLTTALLRCNTSIQPTIAPTQARNAVFYSSKYCSKNPYKLSSTLSFLYTAQLALRNYGSVADDAGSPTRTTKCLMQKVLHKAGHIEVADQQAAAANLGYDSFFSSHKFCYVFIWDAVKRFRGLKKQNPSPNDDSDSEEFASVLEVDEEGNFFSITQFEKYIYKSSAFSYMSLLDYACCITHVQSRKKNNYLEINSKVGRKSLKRYPFEGSGCTFPETLTQTVSTTLKVPIIAGAPPPAHPGEKPVDGSDDDIKVWEKNARIFVEFYALLFLPFDEEMNPRDPTMPDLPVLPWNRDTSWDNFTTILRSWDVDTCGTGDTRMWYKRSTYRYFHNLVNSFKQPKLTRVLLAKWRSLSADKRTNLNEVRNASETASTGEVWNKYSSDEDGDDLDDTVVLLEILRDNFGASRKKLSRSEQLQLKVDSFLDQRTRSLIELTDALTVDSEGGDEKVSIEAYQLSTQPYTVMSIEECTKVNSMIKKGDNMDEVVDNDEFGDEDHDGNIVAYQSFVAEEKVVLGSDNSDSSEKKLTPKQRLCVEEMRKEMQKGQMLVFVHGPPGSGKTTTARLLVSENDLEVVFSGTTGTASAQHKARTINSLLHLGRSIEDFDASNQRISPEVKNKIRCNFGDARILVIDEISMLNVVMLALIDLRLRQCFDSEKLFGGIHIILMGDMFQFPPIGRKLNKPALYQAAVLCSRNRKLPNNSYRTGANLFMKFRLLPLKEQKRADADFARFLKPLRDTSREHPVTRDWVKKLRTLTATDIQDDPSWAFATIATTGNDERMAITRAQIKRFGWVRNEPVLRWICPVRSGKVGRDSVYANLEVDTSLLKGKYSYLCCFFVRGAKCVLSENLCTSLGYAKGTQGVLDSVIWDPDDGEVPMIERLPKGEVTTVRQPKFILVRVKEKLIPIGYCNGRFKCKVKQKIRFINFRMHPVDLLFAVTYHKLQGVTLDKLILAINKHPNYRLRLVLSSLYVGISRVHKLEEVRVLPYTAEDVDYLITLKLDNLLKDWMNNYTKGGHWKYDGFKEFERKMLEQTILDLGLVDDLSSLTIDDCRDYLSKLDIIATGSKVTELRSALRERYLEGRRLLNADNGILLVRRRTALYKQLKNIGDFTKLSLQRLRFYGKRLGISMVGKMGKQRLITALRNFEGSST